MATSKQIEAANQEAIAQAIANVRNRVTRSSMVRLYPTGWAVARRDGANIHCGIWQVGSYTVGIIRPNGRETWEARS